MSFSHLIIFIMSGLFACIFVYSSVVFMLIYLFSTGLHGYLFIFWSFDHMIHDNLIICLFFYCLCLPEAQTLGLCGRSKRKAVDPETLRELPRTHRCGDVET